MSYTEVYFASYIMKAIDKDKRPLARELDKLFNKYKKLNKKNGIRDCKLYIEKNSDDFKRIEIIINEIG